MEETVKRIEGIIPALITPYDDSGAVSESALRAIIDRSLEEGVGGFYAGGSTSEAFLLADEERVRVFEIVSDHVAGRVPLICHVGSISTNTACRFAREAARCGADAVSAIPPFYYRFTLDEIERYYLDIADATSLPLILYNFPGFTGVTIDHESAPALFSDDRIVGIKHTSLDLYQLERMKRANSDFIVLNGHDEVLLAALSHGADGAVGSTYNFMAGLFVRIRERFLANDLAGAREAQNEANDIIAVLKRVGVYNGIKCMLELQGIQSGECRRPFLPLDAEARGALRRALEASPHVRGPE